MPHHQRTYRAESGDFTIPGAEPVYPPDLSLEPVHLDITFAVDIPSRSGDGCVVTTVKANRPDAVRLVLHACDLEDVVVDDPLGGALRSHYNGREIEVVWERPFAKDEERKVRVAYRVDHPVSGLEFCVPDEDYPDRAPWVASDHETERARYWLPCVDLPAVRTTLAFHLTASEDFTILAGGVLESEENNGDGTKTAHWILDYPCPSYLLCFAIGDFVRADDTPFEGREIAYFGARGRVTEEDLGRSFGRTPEIMEWMTAKFGNAFPFAKYFQFALPGFGGAMENISLVSWDDIFVTDEVLAKDLVRTTDIVNVHEMAHSYFGDAVVCRDFAHAWLKESWATYTEALWYEDKHGEDEFRYDMLSCARRYIDEADTAYKRPIVTRVFNSSWNMYDRHLYPGGACRLHMLRRELGEEIFWPAVHDYLARYSKKTVETEDFRRLMEEHSGRSLVEFFDQWFYRKGFPDLAVTFAHDAEKGEASFSIEQKQVPKDGKEGETPFRFDLVIAWQDEEEAWDRRTVRIQGRTHQVTIPLEKAPRQVRIDPDGTLLHRLDMNPGDAMLRTALVEGPDIVARILAAEELGKTGKRKNLESIRDAYAGEAFWGVRAMMVAAVAKTKSHLAPGLLAGLAETETNPWVQRILADSMAAYRHPAVVRALEGLLDGDPTYLVKSAALRALGAQRGEEHFDRLLPAAGDTGYRGLVRSGALTGLGSTRSDTAREFLRGRIAYGGEMDDSAPAACRAYAQAARFAERRWETTAVEDLCEALRDPRYRVRRAAGDGLSALRAKSAIPHLERMLTTLPVQDHPTIRRLIIGLRGDDEDGRETAVLRKDLEDLIERYRKLEERMEKLEGSTD